MDFQTMKTVWAHDPWIFFGFFFLAWFLALDTYMRIRMFSVGDKWIFIKGGLFNYNDYLKAAAGHGWPKWPFYAIWPLFVLAIALLGVGISKL